MEDIVEATGLSKGGLYHYYGSTKEILIDMMRHKNIFYMTLNPHMQTLGSELSKSEKADMILDALMEKCLVVTDDRKIYTMFLHEVMYDSSVWTVYLEMENEFFDFICERLTLDLSKHAKDLKLISRLMNAFLLSQNMSLEPEVFVENQLEITQMLRPIIDRILE